MCTMLRLIMTSGNCLYFLPCCSLSRACICEQGLQTFPMHHWNIPNFQRMPSSITLSHTAINSLHVIRKLLRAV